MRSLVETRTRWNAALSQITTIGDLSAAVKDAKDQSPCSNGLRSICWKSFLLFKSLDFQTWSKSLLDSRSAYSSLKEHFLKDIENADDVSAEDPLTDTETSPWNLLRLDEEQRAEIFLDVERCMPENAYYREPSTQSMLLDILFIWCKLNRDVGYRQGMHEVLAPIVWVVSRDAIDPSTLSQDRTGSDQPMISCLDNNYIEHDAFSLFAAIMQTVKGSYEMGSNTETATSGLMNNSPIMERSKKIHENYLYHADPELAEHLTAIEILPQIFLIRWIRLLFGREFLFEDVLTLWDVLFAEDPGLDSIDMVAVAMLLRIRWQLLEADYSAALTLLLRYPAPLAPHGPATFVGDAIYLRHNLLLDGGDHIISKYSRRAPETTVTRKLPKKIKRARTADQEVAQNAMIPRTKPARIFQDQRGIEGIIHEAAKGMYSRGEKWGVGKALRGAMQGLQSGHNSPRRISERSREAPSSKKLNTDKPSEMIAKVEALEQRNRALAKLLGNAVDELWIQQKNIHGKDNEATADALSLSIAKVQFVQVYLENSAVPLPPDEASSLDKTDSGAASARGKASRASPPQQRSSLGFAQTDGSAREVKVQDQTASQAGNLSGKEVAATAKTSPPTTPKVLSPPPRPSLEKSPFSWMLGEDHPKSDFVAPSPFQLKKKSGRSEKLFGDPRASDEEGKADSDDDVFTMGRRTGHRGR